MHLTVNNIGGQNIHFGARSIQVAFQTMVDISDAGPSPTTDQTITFGKQLIYSQTGARDASENVLQHNCDSGCSIYGVGMVTVAPIRQWWVTS